MKFVILRNAWYVTACSRGVVKAVVPRWMKWDVCVVFSFYECVWCVLLFCVWCEAGFFVFSVIVLT